MRIHSAFPFIVGIIISSSCIAQSTSILFIGNSYTGSNNLPLMVEQLALSLGDTVLQDRVAPGGYTYQAHSTNPTTITKINSNDWDYVVLQEQSQRPSFPPAQVASDVYPYAEILIDSIRANNSCSEPVFFMTWGRENGDQSNCMSWPPVCTYIGMQARLRESYLEMTTTNSASCAPVGVAWKNVRDANPTISLYNPDGSHPSIQGSYLAACTFYATIFRKSPVGASFISSLTASDAMQIQQIAAATVLDSLEVWNIGTNDPMADFTYNDLMNGTVQFDASGSVNSTSYSWSFGDGAVGSGMIVDHSYLSGGSFDVQLVVSDDCGNVDTAKVTTMVVLSGVNEVLSKPSVSLISEDGTVSMNYSGMPRMLDLRLHDTTGRLLNQSRKTIDAGRTLLFSQLRPGSYVIVLSDNGTIIHTSPISVH